MNAEEYSKRGDKYFHERNFDGAIADYTEVIKLESDNPFAYSKRGMSYVNKKEYDLAIADFTEAIRLEPNKFGDFYMDRASVYVIKGNNALAITDLEMAVKIDPQNETYRGALKDIKSGASGTSTNTSSKTDASIRKEIKVILIGAIIGGIIGAIAAPNLFMEGRIDLISVILGIWMGLCFGGTITLVPFLFKLGWNLFGLWSWLIDFVTDIFSGSAGTLRVIFFFLRLFLGAICVNVWLVVCVIAGPIWPLIRLLIKKSQINKMEA